MKRTSRHSVRWVGFVACRRELGTTHRSTHADAYARERARAPHQRMRLRTLATARARACRHDVLEAGSGARYSARALLADWGRGYLDWDWVRERYRMIGLGGRLGVMIFRLRGGPRPEMQVDGQHPDRDDTLTFMLLHSSFRGVLRYGACARLSQRPSLACVGPLGSQSAIAL